MFSVNRENRASYYKYLARLNYEAACAADRKIGFLPGYEIAAPPPVMTLCAHSIELCFKAFLLDNGLSERDVRNYGHDVSRLLDKCVELGADITIIDHHIVRIISDLIVSHRLRYGEPSKLGLVPVFGPLSTLCEACLSMCGAPAYSDLTGQEEQ